jgi:hypothetical protein
MIFGPNMDPVARAEAAARAARAFAQPIEGPSHRPVIRYLAVAIVVLIMAWGARQLWQHGVPSGQAIGASAMVLLLLLWPLPGLFNGRTRIDATGIHQQGFAAREVQWSQVQRVRFIRLALTPRLVVSSGFGRMKVFYSGSRELDEAFEHVVDVLTGPSR